MTRLIWCCFIFVTVLPALMCEVDTAAYNKSLSQWGRIAADTLCIESVSKQELRTLNYSQLGDALKRATPFVPLSHGSMGQPDGIEVFGILPNGISIAVNGRPFQDTWAQLYDPLRFAPTAIERIEILAGSDAIGSTPELAFVATNLQRIVYNTASPHVSMWYNQGAGDLVSGSVAYAQNVSERASIAGTVRRSGARGVYQSTDFDTWNVHLQSRYQIEQHSQLLLNYDVVSSSRDGWGGVVEDPLGSSQLVETLPNKYPSFRDQQRRHDVELSFCSSSIGDSSVSVMSTLYAASDTRQRADTTARGTHLGAVSRIDYRTSRIGAHAGVRVEQVNADTHFSRLSASVMQSNAWAKGTLSLTESVTCSVSGQLQTAEQTNYGFGGAVCYQDSMWKIRLDASSITGRTEFRSGTMFIGEIQLNKGPTQIRALLYRHLPNGFNTPSQGIILACASNIGSITIAPTLRYASRAMMSVASETFYGDLAVSYNIRTASSTVQLGTLVTLLTGGYLPQYDPYRWRYDLSSEQNRFQHNGVDIFASVQVGTASIRASFENILGNRWYTIAYLPEIPRQFRLSVDWTFVD